MILPTTRNGLPFETGRAGGGIIPDQPSEPKAALADASHGTYRPPGRAAG
jgi:hypothetical protein